MFEQAFRSPCRQPLPGASPWQALKRFVTRPFIFIGRASRSEYWWVFAAIAIASVPISKFDYHAVGNFGTTVVKILLVLLFISFLALTSRRIQDAGFPGVLLLLLFIPVIGTIPIFVLTFLPTSKEWLKTKESEKA
jgi:protein of hypothetical function (DUF805)